ncbi:hydroxyacylglutathione hydrolase [Tritonibacter scottomollicae]|uniref:Hydroxyacylglutathione hydrolase n=1 Tax=Tritonibacter scottomollicae TaxID=483013 RepID=A0ABZ0HLA4_TRISK|nr:hydroxyacylglutathione hydrolase [Tritonibacter scottomollicae]WOI34950.1 hydroxyacylglutathione hydrolase [Tritonibacter scottomollicae]
MTMPDQASTSASALEIVTVACLSDNYAYLVKGPDGVAVIDAPEAAPIIDALEARGWTPAVVMITHHHHDHVGGIKALRDRYGCTVMGPKAEADKIAAQGEALDMELEPGFEGGTGAGRCQVLAVPGHTLGHIAFYYPEGGALFTADSLMALGCGRLFEGTPAMMWQSLTSLAALPDEIMVYSGHEYTQSNASFALSIDPDNAALQRRAKEIAQARVKNAPTVPVALGVEKATNPFLRAGDAEMKKTLGMEGVADVEVFAHIRSAKDRF